MMLHLPCGLLSVMSFNHYKGRNAPRHLEKILLNLEKIHMHDARSIAGAGFIPRNDRERSICTSKVEIRYNDL